MFESGQQLCFELSVLAAVSFDSARRMPCRQRLGTGSFGLFEGLESSDVPFSRESAENCI